MSGADDEEVELPFVIKYEIGHLPDEPGQPMGTIAVQITYATSHERFEKRQWDTAVYALDRSIAIELGKALLHETGEVPKAPRSKPVRH